MHVVAYDGVRFCGPFNSVSPRATERAKGPVTCLFCMRVWSGWLKGGE